MVVKASLDQAKHILEVELSSFRFVQERLGGGDLHVLSEFGRGYVTGLERAVGLLSCGVAQLAERGTVNSDVGGSRPSTAVTDAQLWAWQADIGVVIDALSRGRVEGKSPLASMFAMANLGNIQSAMLLALSDKP